MKTEIPKDLLDQLLAGYAKPEALPKAVRKA